MSVEITRHEMPNGGVVYFKEYTTPEEQERHRDHHSYWRESNGDGSCSGRLPGISTIAKCDGDNNKDGLLNWAVKLGYEGVAREAALGLAQDDAGEILGALNWLRSPETIRKAMEAEKTTWKHIRSEKGTIGWQAHDVLERLAKGETPDPQTPYDEAVISWWSEREPEPLESEQVVYSAQHGFAGRFDLRCGIGKVDSLAPVVWLLDAKSSNYIGNAFAIQLNLYNLAAIECGIGGADYLMILKVNDDATFQEIPVPVNQQWALDSLAVYTNAKQIKQAITHGMKR
jgi:hypothetical protein